MARRFSAGTSLSTFDMKLRIPSCAWSGAVGLALDQLLRREAAALVRRLVRERALQRSLVLVAQVLARKRLGD
eukprot:4650664-Prymnesium_polylepis.1